MAVMRRRVAGWLIRLAHCIYPPRVTETPGLCPDSVHIIGKAGRCPCGRVGGGSGVREPRAYTDEDHQVWTDSAVYIAGPMGPAVQAEYERRESRWT